METRSTRSTMTFSNEFNLPGLLGDLPPGDYEVLAEDELLEGLSFLAYRRTATYLSIRDTGARAGKTELREVAQKDLDLALIHDLDHLAFSKR